MGLSSRSGGYCLLFIVCRIDDSFLSNQSFPEFYGDLILFPICGVARFFTTAAALETGSSFEGMVPPGSNLCLPG